MSIYINNFFLEAGEVVECTSLVDFSVDVTDGVYDITTSGTYFIHDGYKVPTYFTNITNGYTVIYSTVPSGNMLLNLRAHNTNNDIVTKEYEFYFGYASIWNEVVYWGADTEVPISISATNDVVAPNTSYFSTFFHTHKPYVANIGSEITADGSGNMNLNTTIRPQSKYFIYGKTYNITLSGVKDFSGNVLDPITFTFKIENE